MNQTAIDKCALSIYLCQFRSMRCTYGRCFSTPTIISPFLISCIVVVVYTAVGGCYFLSTCYVPNNFPAERWVTQNYYTVLDWKEMRKWHLSKNTATILAILSKVIPSMTNHIIKHFLKKLYYVIFFPHIHLWPVNLFPKSKLFVRII